jgi:DNA-binding NarL/FixJ family response regulator
MSIRVVIADDHPVVGEGLVRLLQAPEFEVVGRALSGAEALEACQMQQPDVLVLDIRMPDKSGLAVLEELKQSGSSVKVVVLSGLENTTYIARSLALGAVDFVPKSASGDVIVDSILRAGRGEGPRSDSPILNVRASMSRKRDATDDDIPLTNRELQVLRHIALGLSNREIGQSLNISIETVKEHVQNILRKLDTPDRTAAAVWAVKRGLV